MGSRRSGCRSVCWATYSSKRACRPLRQRYSRSTVTSSSTRRREKSGGRKSVSRGGGPHRQASSNRSSVVPVSGRSAAAALGFMCSLRAESALVAGPTPLLEHGPDLIERADHAALTALHLRRDGFQVVAFQA